MRNRVNFFDNEIPVTRERLISMLNAGLFSLPVEVTMQCVQECQWPTETVCRDLNLPFDFVLKYRGTYEIPKRSVLQNETDANGAEQAAAARIKELGDMVRKLSMSSRVENSRQEKGLEKPTTI